MGLFNKLKEILFDEETVEIPVITKEEIEETPKKKPKEKISEEPKDEVIIRKIETSREESEEEDLFDMPKLKMEAEEEKKINTFTFPVFDDDDKVYAEPKRTERRKEEKPKRLKETREGRSTGYNNAFDYSYGKYKGDYKSNREAHQDVLVKSVEEKEKKQAFKPSPIISPVYGVLNENYKKEDIVTKNEKIVTSQPRETLDLDSVRRKAYGTLEDEIEESLNKIDFDMNIEDTKEPEMLDEGISIDDLLVDQNYEVEETPIVEEIDDTELFNTLNDDVREEIDLDDTKEHELEPIRKPELDDNIAPRMPEAREINMEKTEDKKEALGEEDLFDLIDSLYDGKDEE